MYVVYLTNDGRGQMQQCMAGSAEARSVLQRAAHTYFLYTETIRIHPIVPIIIPSCTSHNGRPIKGNDQDGNEKEDVVSLALASALRLHLHLHLQW